MTDQKRDEPVPRLPPLQSDPARRIRRIQRWLGNVSEEFNGIPCYVACHAANFTKSEPCGCYEVIGRICDSCEKRNDRFNGRVDKADALFAAELAWLCSYASGCAATIDMYSVDRDAQTIAEQKARIEELESLESGLRRGLEDIRSLRRISTVADIEAECDFYLNREA